MSTLPTLLIGHGAPLPFVGAKGDLTSVHHSSKPTVESD